MRIKTKPRYNVSGKILRLLKGTTPASFSLIFGLFKQTMQFLQQINVKMSKCHSLFVARIRTHDLKKLSHHP